MKRFVKELFLFSIPFFAVGIVVGVFFLMISSTGEFMDVDSAVLLQRKEDDRLIGYAYNEQMEYLKIINVNYYKPDIIALGTSRVMQYKDDYFEASFYNCGGTVRDAGYDKYRNFLENLAYKPKVIILGIDYWLFNPAWNKNISKVAGYEQIQPIDRSLMLMMKDAAEDVADKKWKLSELRNYPHNIGVNGSVRNYGFMIDGSMYYGHIYSTYSDSDEGTAERFADTYERIQSGVLLFEYGDSIEEETVESLDGFLGYCEQNDITIIGVISPLPHSIITEMRSTGKYNYIESIPGECKRIFERHSFELYDYLDGEKLGFGNEYYVDGFHGGDVVYAGIIKDIYGKTTEELFKSMIDADGVEAAINSKHKLTIEQKEGIGGHD